MRAIVTTPKTQIKLNGITCRAIAILGALGNQKRRCGYRRLLQE